MIMLYYRPTAGESVLSYILQDFSTSAVRSNK